MKDALGARIKRYEEVSNHRLTPRSPVFIRVDGRAFHTFTKGAEKPFDEVVINAMTYAAEMTANEMQGFKLAYVQSDEATFMITDYDTLDTQGWFNYEVNKIVSITASSFTAYFNKYWQTHWTTRMVSDEHESNMEKARQIAMFDARAFTVPLEDAPNAFIWRQKDWLRNSVQMLARSLYSQKELQGKNNLGLKMMCALKDQDWYELDPQHKYGTWILANGTFVYDERSYDQIANYLKVATYGEDK